MTNLSKVVKKLLVLIIQSVVKHLQRVFPVIRLGDMVRQQVDVLEVNICYMLNQPVFGPSKLTLRNREVQASKRARKSVCFPK